MVKTIQYGSKTIGLLTKVEDPVRACLWTDIIIQSSGVGFDVYRTKGRPLADREPCLRTARAAAEAMLDDDFDDWNEGFESGDRYG